MNSIFFLDANRFQAISRMLEVSPSWEVEGELVCGMPITADEIEFVVKSRRFGV